MTSGPGGPSGPSGPSGPGGPDGPVRLAVLTVSDLGSRGEREDGSGDAIRDWARERGHLLVTRDLVPDETTAIAPLLARWADGGEVDLILTTGGTGLTPRDVTPESTSAIIERVAPGIAEAIRAASVNRFPNAMLSRGIAGVRASTLIVNLPGSPGGVRDGLAVLDPVLSHAVAQLRGGPGGHA